jgi:hypothetical protein
MEIQEEAEHSSRYSRFVDTPVYCEAGNKAASLSLPGSCRTEELSRGPSS